MHYLGRIRRAVQPYGNLTRFITSVAVDLENVEIGVCVAAQASGLGRGSRKGDLTVGRPACVAPGVMWALRAA